MFSRIIRIFFFSALLIARAGYAQLTSFEWLQQPGGVSLSCLLSDGHGNCYAGGDDGYVVRYKPSGVASWAINIAGIVNGSATAIALGPKGEVFVAGYVYDTVNPLYPNEARPNRMWIARLDTTGSLKWLAQSLNISNSSANAIAVSRSGGSVYLAGTETGAISFGGLSLGTSANASIFVARFNSNGNAVWMQRSYDQAKYYNQSNGLSCAVDDSENVYVGGQFSDTINFEGIHDKSSGSTEALIISLDSSGKTRWLKNYGANCSVGGMCYEDGYLFTTGTANVVTRIRTDGTIDKTLQDTIPNQPRAIACDGAGYILIAPFWGNLSLDSVNIPNFSGGGDLLKIDTGFRPLWSTHDGAGEIAMDSLGHNYIGGWSEGYPVGPYDPVGTYVLQLDEWSIACPLIQQGPLCSGDTIEIPVHELGAYPNVNTFTVQISDSLGRFTNPKTIAAVTATKVNSIRAVIPSTLHSGTKYRIRVTASDPGVTGLDNGYDLSVRAAPSVSVNPTGPIDLCEGDSLTLTASGGQHYLWSTGDTTNRIIVGASGNYSVFAIGNEGCGILLPATQVTVRLSPPVPPVTRSGNTLFGNLSGYENQWYLNRAAIPGATGPTLDITYNGTYNLTVSSIYGCASTSDDFVVSDLLPSGVERSTDITAGLTLSPNPASQTATVSFSLPFPERISLSVVDITGTQVLAANDFTYPAGPSSLPLDIGWLPSGTYFVELRTDEAVETRRLVIER